MPVPQGAQSAVPTPGATPGQTHAQLAGGLRQPAKAGVPGPGQPAGQQVPQGMQGMQAGQGQGAQQYQMAPPQAPSGAIRTQSSSPLLSALAPPTPTPANKAIPKAKKEPREAKKRAKKGPGNGGAVTPSATSEPPTPTTPITPQHPNSFSANVGGSNGGSHVPNMLMKATSFNQGMGGSQDGAKAGKTPAMTASSGSLSVPVPAPAPISNVHMSAESSSAPPSSFLDTDAPFLSDFNSAADAGGMEDDLDFDINTFLNDDANSAGGLGFDPTSTFGWGESVEAAGDV
ncbi:uncharacterized protein V1510DRAFT_419908 [Dipodascopsis tothii]|uniref:uncharacterized protein n=1 Tax=Dipodascopsis tothii TaxID=44089 RepID=UPI0034CE19C8